jgi:hypothetical protein
MPPYPESRTDSHGRAPNPVDNRSPSNSPYDFTNSIHNPLTPLLILNMLSFLQLPVSSRELAVMSSASLKLTNAIHIRDFIDDILPDTTRPDAANYV